jgi:hypothetical protein
MHPALTLLLRTGAAARLRRLRHRVAAPRRLILSALGLLLAALWLGNAAASVLLREAADPQLLRRWLPLGFCVYGLWHVIKVAYRRPQRPIEWSPGEEEVLAMLPLPRRQLLAYHLAKVFGAAAFKAGGFTLLMLPDLRLPAAGLLGALAALMFLELWRLNVEIVAWGVSPAAYGRLRAGTLSCLAAAAVLAVAGALATPMGTGDSSWPPLLVLFGHLGSSAAELQYTAVGQVACMPFELFSALILADRYTGQLALHALLAVASIILMIGLTWQVDAFFQRHVLQRQRRAVDQIRHRSAAEAAQDSAGGPIRMLCWQQPAAALVWRQLRGVRHHATSLLIALAAPAALALLPIIVYRDPIVTFLNVTAGLAFYSLLLLPAALRFDFRRDIDRMALLKSLPISARTVVIGQLAAPVIVASVFQFLVLVLALVMRPVHPSYLIGGWLLLVPMNLLIFSLDNLIFLLYPYRANQEGLEVFLRTTLTFTAKGMIFAVGLVITAAWALLAGYLVHQLASGSSATTGTRLLFAAGMEVMLLVSALTLAALNIPAFQRFDASQDTPA